MPKPINIDDPIIVLTRHLKTQTPDYFNKLNPRARLTCERICDGVQLNWLDKLGSKVLQNQFEKPSLAGKVWSLMTTALYKMTLLFHSLIYWNWKAPSGDDLIAKFNPKPVPVLPPVPKSVESTIPSKLNPTPNRPISSGPIVEEVSGSEDEAASLEESEIQQAPQKFREVADAIQAESNEEIEEEKVAKARNQALAVAQEEEKMRTAIAKKAEEENVAPSMIVQTRSSISGSSIGSDAVLDSDVEAPKVDINLIRSIASEIEQSTEEVPEIAPEVDPKEAALFEARIKAQQERADNFMKQKMEREAPKPVSGEVSDEEGLLITDEELAAL